MRGAMKEERYKDEIVCYNVKNWVLQCYSVEILGVTMLKYWVLHY